MKNTLLIILAISTLVLAADKFFGKKPEDINKYVQQIADMSKTVVQLQDLCKK